MTATHSDPAAMAALAAAVAAAADIAKNSPLFYSETPAPKEEKAPPSNNDDKTATGTAAATAINAKHFTPQEEDAEKRLARSRERNREHARRTRLRKKAQFEALQARVTELEEEGRVLKQSIEECSIASILVGLSSGNQYTAADTLLDVKNVQTVAKPKVTRVGKRKRFVVEDGGAERVPQPLKLHVGGKMTLVGGGKSHINWKSGLYCDEEGVQLQLTPDQLESLRRERNRMHAKMTRDRKKSFISSVEKTIQHLEGENKRMRNVLTKVADMMGSESVTPITSPKLAPSITPDIQDECVEENLVSKLNKHVNDAFDLNTA